MDTRRLISVIVIASVVLLLVLLLTKGCGDNRKGKWDWKEHYRVDKEQPYDLSLFKKILDKHTTEEVKILNDLDASSLPSDAAENATYVFVGDGQYLDSTRLNPILEFVKNGHTAFISCRSVAFNLMFYIYYQECYNGTDYAYWDDFSVHNDTISFLNFKHQDIKLDSSISYQAIGRNTILNYRWQYMDSIYFCEYDKGGMVSIGYLEDSLKNRYTNFAKVQYGDGTFYLHSTPLAMSNVQLLDTLGLNYLDGILSHIPNGTIYWDEASKTTEGVARRANAFQQMTLRNRLPRADQNPIKHILANRGTRWAWFGLLALGLTYLLFRAKRRQRVIPVLKENKNTSLDFISTIGGLYFQQRADKSLAETKMKLFLGHIRRRYDIHYRDNDEEFIKRLSIKSEVPSTIISDILKMYNGKIKHKGEVNDYDLIRLNRYIEDFYKLGK